MAKISRLSDLVINQIAAGEVVERPANVVKELVDNAIDAGASRVKVELKNGGCDLIAISDNGSGMSTGDAELAVQRHATSKIRDTEDLFSIRSMGFRGEALASIAAVSKFKLQTSDGSGGAEIILLGGDAQPAKSCSRDQGTTVVVEELFFNVPARQQFMRRMQTEYAHCLEYLQALSLANLSVDIELTHNGRVTFRAPVLVLNESSREEAVRHRFATVTGQSVDDFVWIEKDSSHGKISGLISPPGSERASTKSQFFYVNQRWVRDNVLRYGVTRGYHSHLLKGRHPVVALYLDVDPGLVDVNVHPAKTELRFQYREETQKLVATAIREGLRQGAWVGIENPPVRPLGETPPARSHVPYYTGVRSGEVSLGGGQPVSVPSRRPDPILNFGEVSRKETLDHSTPPFVPTQKRDAEEVIPWSSLSYLGVFAKCYLMFQSSERLLVVDQHAWHERILFERLCANQEILTQSQRLLMPEEVTLAATVVDELTGMRDSLNKLGFDFEIATPTSIEVAAIPVLLSKRDPEEVFTALGKGGEREIPAEDNSGINQNLLATMACHAAVRAGEELSDDDLCQLLTQAAGVDFYHNCPHGRRVFRWWKLSQVESWFDR